jgi:predicted phage terminase large subunit-like protein
VIIEMPPRHGKSEGTSRRLPPFLFGRNPAESVILCSHTLDLAKEMARDVRQVMGGDRYRELFPGIGMRTSRRDRDRAELFDVNGVGTFKAAGVGTGIGGRGFSKGVIDDYVKDREDANSPTFREHLWRWYTSVFYKRQAKGAGILITSTRWHEDDLIGRLKRKVAAGESEPYDVLTLPALATDRLHPDDWRQPGEALWPWFKTAAEHEQTRLLEPRDFYALDQQDPRSEGGTEWPASLFPASIWFDDWPHDLEAVVVQCDPSKGKSSKHGDYSALVVVARDRAGHLWIEADLARRPADVIVAATYELVRRMRKETGLQEEGVGFETDGFAELFVPLLLAEEQRQGISLPIYNVSHGNVPKTTRVRRLTPFLTAGKLHFRATPGTRLLVRQLEQFPVADHDDGPDGLEQAIRLLDKLWPWGRPRPGCG